MALQCDLSAPANLCGVRTYFNPDSQFASNCDRLLLIGQKLAGGTAPANVPVQIFSDEETLFGAGSMLDQMVKSARQVARFSEIWALPLADFGTKASADIAITSTLTAAATLYLIVNGGVYSVAATPDDTDDDIAAAFAAVIDDAALAVSVAGNVLTVEAVNGGEIAGYLDVRTSYNRMRIFENPNVLFGVTLTAPAGVPDLAAALDGLGMEAFTFIAQPYHDGASMAAFKTYLCSTWAPMDRRRAEGYTAIDADPTVSQAIAATMNSGLVKLFHREGFLRPEYATTAAVAALGQSRLSSCRDPLAVSEPLHGQVINGEMPPDFGDVAALNDLDTLVGYGLSPLGIGPDGRVNLAAFRTTYLTDDAGVPDFSLRGGNVIPQLRFVAKYLEDRIWGTYAGYSLRSDDFQPRPGQKVVTLRMLRAFVQGLGYPLSDLNVIQDPDGFADLVTVSRDPLAGSCVNIAVDPTLVEQLCCVNLFINSRSGV